MPNSETQALMASLNMLPPQQRGHPEQIIAAANGPEKIYVALAHHPNTQINLQSLSQIHDNALPVTNLQTVLQRLDELNSTTTNMPLRVKLCEQALALVNRVQQSKLWAALCVELGSSFAQSPQGSQAENIERAIIAYEGALQVRTREAMLMEWAETTTNLAIAYLERIRGDKAKNLERAIAACKDVLQVWTRYAMPVEWAEVTVYLAIAYSERIRGDKAENLELSITAYEAALQVRTRDAMPVAWAATRMNLANAYRIRIRGDRAENMEHAIAAYKDTLQVMNRDDMPVEWAEATMNLAIAYPDRIRGDKAENIEQAIAESKDALLVMTRDAMPVAWATACMNLANVYRIRIRGDKAKNMERAIVASKGALQVMTRDDMPVEWAEATMNLANAYLERIKGDKAENMERAINASEEALQVMTRDAMPVEWAKATMSLAIAYSYRIRGNKAKNVERAIAAYEDALLVRTRDAMPSEYRQTQRNMGYLFSEREEWPGLVKAFTEVLSANSDLYQIAVLPEARQGVLREARRIPEWLAYGLIRVGGVHCDEKLSFEEKTQFQNIEEAVLTLEVNRARWLREILDLRGRKSDAVPDTVWQQFVAQGEMIRELQAEAQLPENTPAKRDFLTLSNLLREARQQLDPMVEAIRQADPDFLPTPTFDEIQAVSQQIPLVYLLTTSAGSAALIVKGDQVIPLLLDGFTGEDLDTLLLERDETDEIIGGYLVGQLDNPHHLIGNLNPLLATLGQWLMGPVAEVLRDDTNAKPEVILIPAGNLALFPLHAARYAAPNANSTGNAEPDEHPLTSFMDEFTVHYAPSARSIAQCLEQRSARAHHAEKLVGIGNPRPIPDQPNFSSLPHAKAEMEEISELLPPEQVEVRYEQEATRAALFANLPDATLLHLSCHGTFNPDEILDSGLLLADGMLTLRTLLDPAFTGLDSTRLVTLSACQTAITDFQNVPNEVIGLPAGFLQAGVPGVVGTLWPVEDRATSLLMRRFYDNYLNKDMEPAYALQDAQLWLRDATRKELGEYYESFTPRISPEDAFDYSVEMFLEGDEQEQPYIDPYFWAGFTFHGV